VYWIGLNKSPNYGECILIAQTCLTIMSPLEGRHSDWYWTTILRWRRFEGVSPVSFQIQLFLSPHSTFKVE